MTLSRIVHYADIEKKRNGMKENLDGDLILDLLDGSATDEQIDELGRRLPAEPELADRLAAQARLSAILERMGRESDGKEDVISFAIPARRGRLTAFRVVGAAAAGLFLAFGVYLIFMGVGRTNERPENTASLASEDAVEVVLASPGVVVRREGRKMPLRIGQKLRANDSIETKRTQEVSLDFLDRRASVIVRENTLVRFRQIVVEKRLDLDRGTIAASIVPQHKKGFFVVRTPHAVADVAGTKFIISAERGITTLNVEEGVVRFMSRLDGSVIEVAAEEDASAGIGGERQQEIGD